MARLEAVKRALFYPTPGRVCGLIAKTVCLEFAEGGVLLDACAGEGDPAAFFADWWGLRSYGIELDVNRALLAAEKMDVVKRGSYHQLTIEPNQCVSVLFLNPPYDEDDEETEGASRQEVVFLRSLTPTLVHDGLLVYVVPRKILANRQFRDFVCAHYRNVRAWKFPSPEADSFNQVVVFARRHNPTHSRHFYYHGTLSSLDEELPVLGESSYGTASLDQDEHLYSLEGSESAPVPAIAIEKFALRGKPPEDFVPSHDPASPSGAYASQRWALLTTEAAVAAVAPLVAPRPGHQAMLLAAGRLNGCEIDGHLMKGGSSKTTETIEREKETIERERIVSHLSMLSLETGDVETWRVDEDPARTAEWFQRNGAELARAIMESHTPSFDGDLSNFDFGELRAPGILPGREEPELLQIQMEAAAATVHRWRRHKTTILCGEQGTGKTTMGIVATTLARHRKVVVVCPSHLVPKWIRECGIITRQPNIARVAKKLSDVDAFFADPAARYLILSKEMAKLGARWAPAFHVRKVIVKHEIKTSTYSWETPKTEIVRTTERAVACPDCGKTQMMGSLVLSPRAMDMKTRRQCWECGAALWTSTPINAHGTRRWALARYLNRRYANQYSCVLDEAHQFAAPDSDQGRAAHMLASGASKILAMTGTLYGGRASSIFHLLYRIDHDFRLQYEHNECSKFVEHHGLFEQVYQTEERTSIYNYRKGRSGGRIREIPGMSPAMVPMLLPYTIFVKLRDMQIELPPYSEEVEIVHHDPDVETAAQKLADAVHTALNKFPQLLGQYLAACLGYPDKPEQPEEIVAETEDGPVILASAPSFPSRPWPKDLRVADICREEVDAGRRCLIFFAQTHRRDARDRVRGVLEARGLRVVTLDSNVEPDKREQWLRDADERGFDVMLTNGRLVETGMDLLFANTIVQYGVEYSLATLRQSIRRSWRLGQTKPVRVIFMAYARTMQATAMDLIAKKMRAAEMIDGDEAGGLAQHDVGGTNFLVDLAHEAIATESRLPFRPSKSRREALTG